MIILIKAFLIALPDLIKLISVIQKSIEERNTDRKVKDDVRAIREAIRTKDSTALRNIFNS